MARLTQGLSLGIQQKQSLILTNKMKLSLKIASLPILELRQEVLQALEENVALELKDDQYERGLTRIKDDAKKTSDSHLSIRSNSSFLPCGGTHNSSREDFIENIPCNEKTLQDDLLFQVGFVKEDEKVIEVARMLIQNLDEKGFNIVPIKELMAWSEKEMNFFLQDELLRRSIRIVRFLKPLGCACNSIKDYLRFQLYLKCKQAKSEKNRDEKTIFLLASKLIARHFSLLKDQAAYAKAKSVLAKDGCSYTLKQIQNAMNLIAILKPYPSYHYGNVKAAEYITPDVSVQLEKGELLIIPNNYALPRIRIAKEIEMLAEEKTEAGRFAKEKVKEARDLISSIKERENTLIKVIASIIVFQRDFFYYGVKYLSPLRQKDIADELRLANSTISRVIANKYLVCQWGTFPINYFFSHKAVGNKRDDVSATQSNYVASGYSKQACKEIIRNICEANPSISDNKIASLLEKKGIKLARRTITKYRNEMGINVSHKR